MSSVVAGRIKTRQQYITSLPQQCLECVFTTGTSNTKRSGCIDKHAAAAVKNMENIFTELLKRQWFADVFNLSDVLIAFLH